MEALTDFPKVYCPFIRRRYKVINGFKEHGSKLKLREPVVYLVTNEINPGYEWVFTDKEVRAVEKLDGTNVKLKNENGRLVSLMNRKNIVDPLQIMKGKTFIIEGVFHAIQKGYVKESGEQAGECIGPKLQSNPYNISYHTWYPFELAYENLFYKSFYEHERTFDNWSNWFQNFLRSRFYMKAHKCGFEEAPFAEGVIFTSMSRKTAGQTHMAKLRRDMFRWYYEPLLEIGEELPPVADEDIES